MTLSEAKEKFIQTWGCLCVNWGANRTMGQIHALLLVTPGALCTDQILDYLKLSRGSVNMNLRTLVEWGLLNKMIKPGERKEYFHAEKNIWKAFQLIIKQRKKKELDPVLDILNQMACIESLCEESDEFCRIIRELKVISSKVDQTLSTVIESDPEWLSKTFTKVL